MQYSIKDLEKLSSIKAHTIRIWEKRYKIVNPERTGTNIRFYNEQELKRLMNISVLIQNGIKISHIAKLSADEIKDKAFFLLQNSQDQDGQVRNLILSMIELNEQKFEKTLGKSILNIGFEKTMIQLVYPFLDQIGVLWQTGAINPAHEHFISNLIRQKLIVSIDGIEFKPAQKYKKFMLFLPEGELHELGLLFYAYLLKSRGHQVLYLGQMTPFESLTGSVSTWNPDFLLLFIVSSVNGVSYQKYLEEISNNFADKKILVSGAQTAELEKILPKNVTVFTNFTEFIEFLNNIVK
ncbi:MAG: MerR family transcriptional regulator [Bacteroidales bacterium]